MKKKTTTEQIQIDSSIETKEALLSFLKRTKDGEYAKVDPSANTYARIKQSGETVLLDELEETYLFGIS